MFRFLSTSIVRRLNAVILSLISIGLLAFALLISLYNYDRTIQDIRDKAQNTVELSKIALQDPIWNIDEEALKNIVKAIMLDKDVAALQVLGAEGEALIVDLREHKELKFDDLKINPQYVYISGEVSKENNKIGTVHIIVSTAKAIQLIEYTSIMIGVFTLALILIMGFMVWLAAKKFVKDPITHLEDSADHLAHGQLDYHIDTSREDELGSLAKSFAEMRDAIRKKIADLHVLNTTGEILAGLHDQTEALKTALRVMEAQTNVELGSIYLLNQDRELEISAYYPEIEAIAGQESKTFRIGEGIAGRCAKEKRIIHIADTSKDSSYVGQKGEKPRALLCVPMMDDQEIFGVMNFSGDVGKVRFDKDDEEFALTIARLTVVTTKNIQMLNVIEEQNRTLEHKVQERTAQLRQKTNDIQNMLQNMHQGIFTILGDNSIHPEYSAFLEAILQNNNIANQNFMQVMFEASNLGSDTRQQIETAVASLIGSDAMMFDFNRHLLVNEYHKQTADGCNKILELDWDPIKNDLDEIEKIMVTVRDVTELRGLQAAAEKQKRELEIIGQILSVSQKKFQDFLKTSHQFIEENQKLIEKTDTKDKDVIATLFRNMHTIKGNARTYGFKFLTDAVHEAEHTYDELRRQEEFDWDKNRLLNELHSAEEYISQYEEVYNSKLGGFAQGNEGVFIEMDLLEQAKKILLEADLHHLPSLQQTIDQVNRLLRAIGTEKLEYILEGILKALPSLAKELDKSAPMVLIKDHGVRILSEITPMLKDIFMHTFRNAMDHGLETSAERKKIGKAEQGTITLEAEHSAEALIFHFRDDGRGLALGAIKRKAYENGVFASDYLPTDEELAECIFRSGLSTAEAVTEISGRGVGMDAVRQFLQQQGGNIQIRFTDTNSQGADFRPFELMITLPGQYGVRMN